ncbi:Ig-like domain-containing protein [Corynebacterium sp. S7]
MKRNLFSRALTSAGTVLALVAGALAVPNIAEAQTPAGTSVNQTVNIEQNQCVGRQMGTTWYGAENGIWANIGNDKLGVNTPSNVSVTYPDRVYPGETFEVAIQPGPQSTSIDAGRFKYDVVLPSNAAITNVQFEGGYGFSHGDGGLLDNPQYRETRAERIDANGSPNPNGAFARVSGIYTVNNGPYAEANHPKFGLFASANSNFQLPKMKLTVTAPQSVGQQVSFGLRGSGQTPERNGSENFMSFIEDELGNANQEFWCTPGAGAANLFSTQVVAVGTDLNMTSTETDLTVQQGTDQTMALKAQVSAENGETVNDGVVRFFSNGTEIGTANVQNGTATLNWDFADNEGRSPVALQITASFDGTARFSQSQDSQGVEATINPEALVANTVTQLQALPGNRTGDDTSVALTANVSATTGDAIPANTTVTFFRNNEELETVDLIGNEAHLLNVATAVEGESTEYSYSARFNGIVIDEFNSFAPSTSTEQRVTVDGEIREHQTSVVVNAVASDVKRDDTEVTVTANVTVVGDDGRQVPEGTEVQIFRGDEFIATALTDANGQVSTNDSVRTVAGANKFEYMVRYPGTQTGIHAYKASEGKTVLDLEHPITTITPHVGLEANAGQTTVTGTPVALTATVSTDDGVELPDGTEVSFYRDDEAIGTAVASGGIAQLRNVLPSVEVATDFVYTARVNAGSFDEGFVEVAASELSAPAVVSLHPDYTTAVEVQASASQVAYGESVDLTATLSTNGPQLPGGAFVQFRANGIDVGGEVRVDENGIATLTGVNLQPDTYQITARYFGERQGGYVFGASTSEPVEVTVAGKPEHKTATVIELDTEVTAGHETIITATVSAAEGELPSGIPAWVAFYSEGKLIGNQPVSITDGVGTAVLNYKFPMRGTYEVTAQFSGVETPLASFERSVSEPEQVSVIPNQAVIDDRPQEREMLILPSGRVRDTFNHSLVTQPGDSSITGENIPASFTIVDGVLVGTPTESGIHSFTIRGIDAEGERFIQDVRFEINDRDTIVQDDILVDAKIGEFLDAQISESDEVNVEVEGTLPSGVDLEGKHLSGTPTEEGTFVLTLTGTQADGERFTRAVIVTIHPADPKERAPRVLPPAVVDTLYDELLGVEGDNDLSLESGSLPEGLELIDGRVQGIPTQVGPAIFTIAGTDADGNRFTQQINLTVASADTEDGNLNFLETLSSLLSSNSSQGGLWSVVLLIATAFMAGSSIISTNSGSNIGSSASSSNWWSEFQKMFNSSK